MLQNGGNLVRLSELVSVLSSVLYVEKGGKPVKLVVFKPCQSFVGASIVVQRAKLHLRCGREEEPQEKFVVVVVVLIPCITHIEKQDHS